MTLLRPAAPGTPGFVVEGLADAVVSTWAAERNLLPEPGGDALPDFVLSRGLAGERFPATAPYRLRLDPSGRTVAFADDPPAAVDEGLLAALDLALTRAFARQGVLVLHGAGFLLDGRAVLAFGPSGSGKSSLATAALAAGGRVLSDDIVLLDPGPASGGRVAWPGRSDVLLRRGGPFRLPASLDRHFEAVERAGEARLLLSRSGRPELFADALVPHELWTLGVAPSLPRSSREPLAAGPLVAELIRSSSPILLSEACREDAAHLRPLLRSAAALPSFRVALGADLLDDPARALRTLAGQCGESLDLPSRQQ